MALQTLADVPRLRNRVAYRCFGPPDPHLLDFPRIPFEASATHYGLLDDLRGTALTDCDVPLALIYWTAQQGIEFIDLWSVRRRVSRSPDNRSLATGGWRCRVASMKAFLQFQAHLSSLEMAMILSTVTAISQFAYLPAVGVVPLAAAGASACG